jgi:hypothetical protein
MPPAPDSLDAVARDYVRMTLEIGEREEGYVDAYYGPAEWREAARADPRSLEELASAAAVLHARVLALPAPADPLVARRRDFLLAQLTAARTRLRMIRGERLSFAEEAQGLYGVDPEILPLDHYTPILARIDALLPGPGPLADRVEDFQNRFVVPADRIDAVMRAAIDECRRRTLGMFRSPTRSASPSNMSPAAAGPATTGIREAIGASSRSTPTCRCG